MSFWRTRSGVEVDFVVFGPLGFWAIEVKNSDRVFPADVRALSAFLEDYPEAVAILLYRGKDRLYEKNVLCIPCEEFLKELLPNNSLDLACRSPEKIQSVHKGLQQSKEGKVRTRSSFAKYADDDI